MLSAYALNSVTDTLGGGIGSGQGGGSCTTSIVGDRSGVRGFITASHCTHVMYELDGEAWYQPYNYNGATLIGHESIDPAPVTCSFFQYCDDKRNSDVAWIVMDGSLPGRRGAIARPTYRESATSGPLTIDTSHPWINITGAAASLTTGETLDKIGNRTGWSYGTVTATCADIDVQPPGDPKIHRIFCNGRGSIYVGLGDSGGPVFSWDGADGGVYYGDIDGDGCSDLCNDLYFSPPSQQFQDIGTINVASEITVGTPSIAGSISGNIPSLSWSAVSTSHTSATTSYKVYRSTWDASTYTWTEQNNYIGSTTSASYTDSSIPVTVSSYAGGTAPAECVYTYVVYYVQAYNSGIYANSNEIYFQGAANGPTPNQIQCP